MSFINERVQPEGLTFDDVLLIPAYSEVLPREVNVQTRFSRNIKLNIPIVSAAMDTVTEAPLAIALAREGGIGVIHKNMTIAEQAAQVRKVKRAENGMIYDPVTISKDNTVGDALNLMKENKIGGIPVVDADRRLIGIVTNRDLRFQRDMSRLIAEVMTPGDRLITTHRTDLANASEVLLNNKIEKLPVVDDEGHLINVSKARGRKNSILALVDRMERSAIEPEKQTVFISHGDCLADAEFLAQEVRRRLHVPRIEINYFGPGIGAHSGPGTVALFFYSEEWR